jgi:hypothetical protein
MSTGLGEIVLYRAADGGPALDVRLERESIWLTQVQMAELFGVNVPAIFKHIKNIYATGELESGATVSKMEIVRQEGSRKVRRAVDHYNLKQMRSGSGARFKFGRFGEPRVCIYSQIQTGQMGRRDCSMRMLDCR